MRKPDGCIEPSAFLHRQPRIISLGHSRLGIETPRPVLDGFIRLLEWSLKTASTLPSARSCCPTEPGAFSSPISIGSYAGMAVTRRSLEALDCPERVVVDDDGEGVPTLIRSDRAGVGGSHSSCSSDCTIGNSATALPEPTTTHPSRSAGTLRCSRFSRWLRASSSDRE